MLNAECRMLNDEGKIACGHGKRLLCSREVQPSAAGSMAASHGKCAAARDGVGALKR